MLSGCSATACSHAAAAPSRSPLISKASICENVGVYFVVSPLGEYTDVTSWAPAPKAVRAIVRPMK
ncbi:MAG: hypothetical protein C0503_00170 [Gemmatimonas sp.]|nr:hypothetical protein [Gemmatimonas sp.]